MRACVRACVLQAKQWYVIPPRFASRLDTLVRDVYVSHVQKCRNFTRHKEVLIEPSILRAHHIPFSHTRQTAGQYMLLWPGAYHQGFNYVSHPHHCCSAPLLYALVVVC